VRSADFIIDNKMPLVESVKKVASSSNLFVCIL